MKIINMKTLKQKLTFPFFYALIIIIYVIIFFVFKIYSLNLIIGCTIQYPEDWINILASRPTTIYWIFLSKFKFKFFLILFLSLFINTFVFILCFWCYNLKFKKVYTSLALVVLLLIIFCLFDLTFFKYFNSIDCLCLFQRYYLKHKYGFYFESETALIIFRIYENILQKQGSLNSSIRFISDIKNLSENNGFVSDSIFFGFLYSFFIN